MREIKFRAWDNDLKYYCNDKLHMAIDLDGNPYNFQNGEGGATYKLEQFTGLHDCEGKEIYEGDIIKIPDDWDEYGFNAGEAYQVYFAFGGFRLKPKYRINAKGNYLEDDKIKIIGNIHENPELLKGK